jgi:hypothetical protein
MPNTTRWYEIAGNFSPYFTRICFLDNFVEINTRIMRSKISGNFVPSRCITNDYFFMFITSNSSSAFLITCSNLSNCIIIRYSENNLSTLSK